MAPLRPRSQQHLGCTCRQSVPGCTTQVCACKYHGLHLLPPSKKRYAVCIDGSERASACATLRYRARDGAPHPQTQLLIATECMLHAACCMLHSSTRATLAIAHHCAEARISIPHHQKHALIGYLSSIAVCNSLQSAVPLEGLEPPTCSLGRNCSSIELQRLAPRV
jgi:hypothetical protein